MQEEPKVYVGNLSYNTTSEDLNQLFDPCGGIKNINLIMDRETGRSKGFAFISFESNEAIEKALEFDNTEFQGRKIKVNHARKSEGGGRGGRGGSGRRHHGGGGHRGGNGQYRD